VEYVIKLKGISKSYRNKLILKEIDLEIKQGDFIAIIGLSGVGKSTLLNIIGLLEDYEAGTYQFMDYCIEKQSKDGLTAIRNQEIGFVFQMYYLIPHLSVKDNILLPLVYERHGRQIEDNYFNQLVKELGIDHLLLELVDYLSGGEKQRVAIARALINQPKILICDEPTGNLDVENTEVIFNLLKEQNKKGTTVILATHDLQLAKKVDKLYTIKKGELI
jgi:ABC-type lipoprotein export system ATPase subunit